MGILRPRRNRRGLELVEDCKGNERTDQSHIRIKSERNRSIQKRHCVLVAAPGARKVCQSAPFSANVDVQAIAEKHLVKHLIVAANSRPFGESSGKTRLRLNL